MAYALGLINWNVTAMKKPGLDILIKAIFDFANAIFEERYPKYAAQIKSNITRISGSAKIIAANPVTTARLTKKMPNPQAYHIPQTLRPTKCCCGSCE